MPEPESAAAPCGATRSPNLDYLCHLATRRLFQFKSSHPFLSCPYPYRIQSQPYVVQASFRNNPFSPTQTHLTHASPSSRTVSVAASSSNEALDCQRCRTREQAGSPACDRIRGTKGSWLPKSPASGSEECRRFTIEVQAPFFFCHAQMPRFSREEQD